MKTNATRPGPKIKTAVDTRARAVSAGVIFGGIDCYVFSDGSTALSQRGMLRGLRGKTDGNETGNLNQYLARLPEKYSRLATGTTFEFVRPDGGIALGRSAHDFVDMCRAFAEMLTDDRPDQRRIHLARNALAMLSMLAGRGIDEIIYEACGYQKPAQVAIVQAAPQNPYALEQVAELCSMVTKLSAEVSDMRDRLANGGGFIAGTVSPMIGNGIKRRLHVIGQRLAACKAEDSVSAGRQRYTQRLRAILGWTGRWTRMPLTMESAAISNLDAMERAVDIVVEKLNAGRQLTIAVDNTKKAVGK